MNENSVYESNLRSISFHTDKYIAQFILSDDGSIILYIKGVLLRKFIGGSIKKLLEFDPDEIFHGFYASSIFKSKSMLDASDLTELRNAIGQFLDYLGKEMEGEKV